MPFRKASLAIARRQKRAKPWLEPHHFRAWQFSAEQGDRQTPVQQPWLFSPAKAKSERYAETAGEVVNADFATIR